MQSPMHTVKPTQMPVCIRDPDVLVAPEHLGQVSNYIGQVVYRITDHRNFRGKHERVRGCVGPRSGKRAFALAYAAVKVLSGGSTSTSAGAPSGASWTDATSS